ncbi:hypothetical protein [Subtercola boreus]|uniref:hypothetical protein n=1 Tax=Subtercola boreus TaxID=120213 RepID=UPI00209BD4D5|nr:hypothetical protein [Subtercola boreus]
MPATSAGRLADNMRDTELAEGAGEGVAVIGGLFHQVGGDPVGIFAIEVEAEEVKRTGVIG